MNSNTNTDLEYEFGHNYVMEFNNWKVKYGKTYVNAQEELYRLKVYIENQLWIKENQGEEFTLEINQFGDLTREEFRAMYLGYKYVVQDARPNERVIDMPAGEVNQTVNWVSLSDTSPIYNQGQCGSCWSFSATEGIESAYSVYDNVHPTPQLSMEQLVQCSSAYGNQGCNGGLMTDAFQYVQKNPLNTFANYPYTSGTGVTGTCNDNLAAAGKYGISGFATVPAGNCTQLYIANNLQPISIAVDASTWSYYKSGIFSLCGTQLDHGVQLVGYVMGQYWLVRNSWGASWGENGYIQLRWGNTCGLCNDASYPFVGPAPTN